MKGSSSNVTSAPAFNGPSEALVQRRDRYLKQVSDVDPKWADVARIKERHPHSPERVFWEVRNEVMKQKTRSEQTRRKKHAKRYELLRKVVTARGVVLLPSVRPESTSASDRDAIPGETMMRGSTSPAFDSATQAETDSIALCQTTSALAISPGSGQVAGEGDLFTLLAKMGVAEDLPSTVDAMRS